MIITARFLAALGFVFATALLFAFVSQSLGAPVLAPQGVIDSTDFGWIGAVAGAALVVETERRRRRRR
jgi:hypothetical protein